MGTPALLTGSVLSFFVCQIVIAAQGDRALDAAPIRAVQTKNLSSAQAALSRGASSSAIDEHGIPVIWHAAKSGAVEMVRILLDRGADPNARATRIPGNAMAVATGNGNGKVVELLVARSGKSRQTLMRETIDVLRAEEATINSYLSKTVELKLGAAVMTWNSQKVALDGSHLVLSESTTDGYFNGEVIRSSTVVAVMPLEDLRPDRFVIKVMAGEQSFGIDLVPRHGKISRKHLVVTYPSKDEADKFVLDEDSWLLHFASRSDLLQCSLHLTAYLGNLQLLRELLGPG